LATFVETFVGNFSKSAEFDKVCDEVSDKVAFALTFPTGSSQGTSKVGRVRCILPVLSSWTPFLQPIFDA